MAKPLATLLMTRPEPASESFLCGINPDLLQVVEVVISPLLKIVPTGIVPDLAGISGVIFTSSNGVAHGGPGHDLPTFCVGRRTCAAAKARGWRAEMSEQDAAGLIQTLTTQKPATPLLHIAGVHKRADLASILSDAGLATRSVDVYDQIGVSLSEQAQTALSGEKSTIVPLFSPRTASRLVQQLGNVTATHVIALSQAVLDEVPPGWATTCQVAAKPDAKSMTDALTNLLRRVEAGDTPQ